MPGQFCDNGVCSDVMGKCGYAANHSWVSYACGPEPGCPVCSASYLCIDHGCTQPASITISGKGLVGENLTLTVIYPSGPCASCAISYVSPSGTPGSGDTDAAGRFNLPLREKGNYTVTLVRESRMLSIVALAPPSPTQNSLPTVIYDVIAGSQVWLMALLVIAVGLVVYLRFGRGRGGAAENEAPPPGRRSRP
jgi:hypothetical protein